MEKQPENVGTGIDIFYQYTRVEDAQLNHLASEVLESLEVVDEAEIAESLNRTFLACRMLNIPVRQNFRRVFCFDGTQMIADWKMSSLACYLLVINCNPSHEAVARAQLFYVMNHPAKTIRV
jgi:hypothetical protein